MQKKSCEYVEEFNLIDLFFYCMSKWKSILAALLIGAVLGGGFVAGKSFLTAVPEVTDIATGEDDAAENTELDRVNEQLYYMEQLYAYTENSLEAMQSYMTEGRLMEVNPYQLYRGSVVYVVDVPVEQSESVRVILDAYVTEGALYQELEEACGLYGADELMRLNQEKLIDEVVVDVEFVQEGHQVAGVVTMYGQTQEEVEQLLEQTEKSVDAYIKGLSGSYDVKGWEVRQMPSVKTQNVALAEYQKEIRNKITEENKNLTTVKKDVDSARTKVESVEKETQTRVSGTTFSKKEFVLWAMIGAFLGCLIVGGYWLLIYFFGGKLYALSNPEDKFGVPVIGSIYDLSKLKGLDLWVAQKRYGIYSALPVEEQRKIALLNVKNLLKKQAEIHKVLLVSSKGEAIADAILLKEGLVAEGYQVVGCENVIGRADILEQAAECQAAVVVESYQDSKTVLVHEEIAVLRQYMDCVVGMVFTK